jgi:hypothetical protein
MEILVILLLSCFALGAVSSFTPSGSRFSVRKMQVRPLAAAAAADDDDIDLSMDAFQARQKDLQKDQRQGGDFDGYAFQDLLVTKWGESYDVNFNRVETFGFKRVYLNIYPFKLGGRGKWRHETELDYLMHLQAIVEILENYGQLDYVISQIQETNKKPKMGAPIKAVPIRLDLTKNEVEKIMG